MSERPNPYVDGDLLALAEMTRRFAADRVAPGFTERDTTRVLDRGLSREMGELGLIAPELPEHLGGQGATKVAAGVIHEQIAAADLSLSYVNLLGSLNAQILADHGDPEVVGPWLHEITGGRAIVALGLTEPQGGSDAASLSLRMRRDGDDYVLDGEKTSISAADQADIAVVFGRTGGPGARGVTAALVPMHLPGITTSRFDCHGQRAIGRGSIFFDDVRVPVTHRLGDEGGGFVQVMQGFDFSRALIGLQVLGVAQGGTGRRLELFDRTHRIRSAVVGLPRSVASVGRIRHPGRGCTIALFPGTLGGGPRPATHCRSSNVQVVGAEAGVRRRA